MKFSYIIPVHNEAPDIARTIASSLSQDFSGEIEVVVIDDASTDDTAEIVRALAHDDPRIRLVRNAVNIGAAASRNRGVEAATGDVVVMADADCLPQPDFLTRLAAHYEAGAGCVSVESRVRNRQSTVGRYQHATHEVDHGGLRNTGYSQAFSVLRRIALVARFPEELPGCGGEDVEFFDRVIATGCRWGKDPSIVVEHWVPDTLGAAWRQWRGRGRAVPYVELKLRNRPFAVVLVRRFLAFGKTVVLLLSLVPGAIGAVKRSRISERGWRDLGRFFALYNLSSIAHRVGETESLLRIHAEARR